MVCMLVCAVSVAEPRKSMSGFDKWSSVQWFDDSGTNQPQVIKIRALVIDGQVKQDAVGAGTPVRGEASPPCE